MSTKSPSTARPSKLCWNCSGELHVDAVQCPYCGTRFNKESQAAAPRPAARPSAVPAAPYAEMYKTKPAAKPRPQEAPEKPAAPISAAPLREAPEYKRPELKTALPPPFPEKEVAKAAPTPVEPAKVAEVASSAESIDPTLMSLLMLLPGSIFLLFGLVLYLFAVDGKLHLEWNANYWFVYLVLGSPLLYFGWREVNK